MNINAGRCADYLRAIGVTVSEETVTAWASQEREHRGQKRAHNRELKRTCGHFRTSWCAVHHDGGHTDVRSCCDCGVAVEYRGASVGVSL